MLRTFLIVAIFIPGIFVVGVWIQQRIKDAAFDKVKAEFAEELNNLEYIVKAFDLRLPIATGGDFFMGEYRGRIAYGSAINGTEKLEDFVRQNKPTSATDFTVHFRLHQDNAYASVGNTFYSYPVEVCGTRYCDIDPAKIVPSPWGDSGPNRKLRRMTHSELIQQKGYEFNRALLAFVDDNGRLLTVFGSVGKKPTTLFEKFELQFIRSAVRPPHYWNYRSVFKWFTIPDWRTVNGELLNAR